MPTDQTRVFRDIETKAAYYPPGTYQTAGTLLTFYNDLEIVADKLADEFIPLSAAASSGRNPKLFVIGILPPAVNVTGQLLDRTGTIHEVPQPDPIRNVTNVNNTTTVRITSGNAGEIPRTRTSVTTADIRLSCFKAYLAQTGKSPAEDTLALMTCQMLLETGGRPECFNMGQAQAGQGGVYTAEGQKRTFRRPPDGFGKEIAPTAALVSLPPTPKGGTYFLGTGYLGPNSDPSQKAYPVYLTGFKTLDDGVAYQTNILLRKWNQAANAKTVEEYAEGLRHPPDGWPYFQADPGAYKKGLSKILAKYQAQFGDDPLGLVGSAAIIPPSGPSPVGSDISGGGSWAKDGSKEADKAKEQFYKLAGSTFTGKDLGARFTEAQRAQILEIQQALDSMHKAPPLRLIVNPQNFGVKGMKIISDAAWTRNGPIVQHWGDDQDKISASGKVAGFYAIDNSTFDKNSNVAGAPGLSRSIRNFSQSWQNLQSLYLFYKNNGGMWLQDRASQDKRRNLTMVGSVYIYYDNILYIGSFDTFNISEAEIAPFTAEYNFEFTVRAAFLLDRPDLVFSNVSRDARNFQAFNEAVAAGGGLRGLV